MIVLKELFLFRTIPKWSPSRPCLWLRGLSLMRTDVSKAVAGLSQAADSLIITKNTEPTVSSNIPETKIWLNSAKEAGL